MEVLVPKFIQASKNTIVFDIIKLGRYNFRLQYWLKLGWNSQLAVCLLDINNHQTLVSDKEAQKLIK